MKKIAFISSLLLLLVACEDFIQEDIDGFGVVLLTPPEGYTTNISAVNFKWEEVPHADSYRIQIASPDFNSPVSFVLDSLIIGSEWTTSLVPGDYEWRIRGENNISNTAYYARRLSITFTDDLNGQLPQLQSPNNLIATLEDTITFSWLALNGAIDHRFELTDLNSSTVIINNLVPGNDFSWPSMEGSYQWGIQALNQNSSSQFSYRELTIDKSAPSAPVQTSPADTSTISPMATLDWTSGIDNLTAVHDTLYLENLDNNTFQVIPTTSPTYSTNLAAGNYAWKIKSVNEVGLSTNSNQVFQFTVQ